MGPLVRSRGASGCHHSGTARRRQSSGRRSHHRHVSRCLCGGRVLIYVVGRTLFEPFLESTAPAGDREATRSNQDSRSGHTCPAHAAVFLGRTSPSPGHRHVRARRQCVLGVGVHHRDCLRCSTHGLRLVAATGVALGIWSRCASTAWCRRMGDKIRFCPFGLCRGRAFPVANSRAHLTHRGRHDVVDDLRRAVATRRANAMERPRSPRASAGSPGTGVSPTRGEPAMTRDAPSTYTASTGTYGPVPAGCVAVDRAPAERAALWLRLSDYAELAKPRIAAMALLTVLVGYTLGGGTWT